MHVIETVPIADTYCSGVSKIETLSCGNVRLWCYAAQASDCGAGPVENVLTAKIVLPAVALVPFLAIIMGVVDLDNPAEPRNAIPARVVQHH